MNPGACLHTIAMGALAALLTGPAGCAEAPFSVHAQDNDRRTLTQALGRLSSAQRSGGRAMAYVYAGPERRSDRDTGSGERTIYGFDLAGGRLAFSVSADVRSRFVTGGGVLVHRDGDTAISIRDASTGRLRAQAPLEPGETLVGVCADEERIYYVTQVAGTSRRRGQRRSYVVALSTDGRRLWRVAAPGTVGAPAARDGIVAVPYRYQELVLLDGRSGDELSRIRQKDEQIGFVHASQAGILYGIGERGVALLGERSVSGRKESIAYYAPALGSKVRVFLSWDGYRPEQADFTAFDRNRLLWLPERRGDGLGFRDDLAVLHSYRFFFAVDAGSGRIRWAYAQPRINVMSSAHTGTAVLAATQDGELLALDLKSGARLLSHRLPLRQGQQVIGATFDADGFAPPAGAQGQGASPDVLKVLHDIIFDRDSSFIAVKTFAVQALSTIPTNEATRELLRVVTAEAMPHQVTAAAGEALVERKDRDVTAMLVQALDERYDYLEDRRPKGIGILARAAAALDAKDALPALTRQLGDASTPPAALKEVVSALIKIGGKDAIRPLRELVLKYRSDPSFMGHPEPLKAAGEGLLKLGGEPERRTVSYVAEEPRTIAPLAAYYKKLLDETAIRPKPR